MGWGHKFEEKTYYPVNPPAIIADPEETPEQPEPTPLEEPPKAEENAEEQPAEE